VSAKWLTRKNGILANERADTRVNNRNGIC
jgi:hypothetical protein